MTKQKIILIPFIITALLFFILSQGGAVFIKETYYTLIHADKKNKAIESIRKQYPEMEILDITTASGNPVFDWVILFKHKNQCYRTWYSSDGTRQTDGSLEVPNEC